MDRDDLMLGVLSVLEGRGVDGDLCEDIDSPSHILHYGFVVGDISCRVTVSDIRVECICLGVSEVLVFSDMGGLDLFVGNFYDNVKAFSRIWGNFDIGMIYSEIEGVIDGLEYTKDGDITSMRYDGLDWCILVNINYIGRWVEVIVFIGCDFWFWYGGTGVSLDEFLWDLLIKDKN